MAEASGQVWATDLGRETAFGFLHASSLTPHHLNPELVLNNENSSVLRTLRRELRTAERFIFSVAFVTPRALALLKQELIDFGGSGVIVTSDYLGFNTPAAFRELRALQRMGVDSRIHKSKAFHAKGYIFHRNDRSVALFGSANLTESALVSNLEWNIKVSGSPQSHLVTQLKNLEEEQLDNSIALTEEWIKAYELGPRRSLADGQRPAPPPPLDSAAPIESDHEWPEGIVPNKMQVEALHAIEEMRAGGAKKLLVVSATGTGKTVLAALHVRLRNPDQFLFVVHREQIIDRAIQEFMLVLGVNKDEIGKLTGSGKGLNKRFVFATIQTLSKPDVLETIDPSYFSYVIVDESHHVGAETYRRVLDHLKPDFMMGLTATPERTDQSDVFELFDFNVAYEIRLQGALEANMLTPFHYYGVADVEFEDGITTADSTTVERLSSRLRAEHIVKTLELYGQVGVPPKGLIFCSRIEEALLLSERLNSMAMNGELLRTVALTGSDSVEHRLAVCNQLQQGEVDYILTVDIFNEGIDIPSVNQVVMLRQTKSAIVFVQQLGRGLRKSANKEYTVVVDFIGNYANNFLIPIALFGDNSLHKESLKRNLIEAEERGVFANISSIRFDRISQKRVLESITTTKLDSASFLKPAIEAMRSRLGRTPRLLDFAASDSTDPVVLATTYQHFPALLAKTLKLEHSFSNEMGRTLDFLGNEVLDSKRMAEAVVLRELLRLSTASLNEISKSCTEAGSPISNASLESALRTLTFEFHTEPERTRYGRSPVIREGGQVRLDDKFSDFYSSDSNFSQQVDDLLATAALIVPRRYDLTAQFTRGRQYSRKDASRLLRWKTNMMSTIYGYKVDPSTKTCPIFITYHKSNEITSSTQYEDELVDTRTLTWFTRSNRTLQSREVAPIVGNEVSLYVFAKRDDSEGSDFFYLGKATAGESFQTTMSGKSAEPIPVVRVTMKFDVPISQGLFDYFQPRLTE